MTTKTPAQPGITVRVSDIEGVLLGIARVDHQISKNYEQWNPRIDEVFKPILVLLDRKVGRYWTYPLRQIEVSDTDEALWLLHQDEAHGELLDFHCSDCGKRTKLPVVIF